ncbi:hypothetical protein DVB69_01255 [Sporosarcina sp. BI001-red]|uniref:hypothetical protein n=1 Tax=Sporosarcina sp. BI001-red TaxID=2282866 RepID=UPI000E262680|nr:hypothetical protein [Sporosarcina sp. BI001-red]REB11152.1 hypothetical protein DVB69_01255 [Sporosarcina sp. BI001-red]
MENSDRKNEGKQNKKTDVEKPINRKKMSVPDFHFSVSEDNKRILDYFKTLEREKRERQISHFNRLERRRECIHRGIKKLKTYFGIKS